MSLINQVLKDLEHRQRLEGNNTAAILQQVHAMPMHNSRRRAGWRWAVVLLLVTLIVLGTLWYWQQHKPVVANTITASNPIAPNVVVPPPAAVVVAPQVSPAPVAEVTPTNTKVVADAPPRAEVSKAESVKKRTVSKSTDTNAEAVTETPVVMKQPIRLSADEQAAQIYQQAYELVAQQRLRDAEVLLRQALTQDPAQTRLRELLTGLYIKSGRWVEAEMLLAKGMEISPSYPAFLQLRIRAMMQLNQDGAAIALLTSRKTELNAQPELQALLAALYQRKQQHVEAIALYQDLLKRFPRAGIWWVGLGISQEAIGQQTEAQHAYRQARASGSLGTDVARYTDNRLRVLEAVGLGNP